MGNDDDNIIVGDVYINDELVGQSTEDVDLSSIPRGLPSDTLEIVGDTVQWSSRYPYPINSNEGDINIAQSPIVEGQTIQYRSYTGERAEDLYYHFSDGQDINITGELRELRAEIKELKRLLKYAAEKELIEIREDLADEFIERIL